MIDIEKMMANQPKGKFADDFKYLDNGNYDPVNFPLEIFPKKIINIIERLQKTLNYQPQTTSAGILFTVSVAMGSVKVLKVKNGWNARAGMWLSVIGSSGSTKSHPMNWAVKPLKLIESRLETDYFLEMKNYKKLPKKTKEEIDPPERKHRYVNNATVEGLAKGNEQNPVGIGYHIDELKGLFSSFNQYKGGQGNDQEFFLSAFDNGSHVTLRAHAHERNVKRIYIPMLGSIQPEVLRGIATNNIDNGMLQRWLYVENVNSKNKFDLSDVSDKDSGIYNDFIHDIYFNSLRNDDESWRDDIVRFNDTSQKYFIDKMNWLIEMKHNDSTDILMKAYVSKIETYYPRFILIIAEMNSDGIFISDETVFKANNLANYFIASAKAAFNSMDLKKIVDMIFEQEKCKTKTEKIQALYKNLPEMSVISIASFSGSTRDLVYKTKKVV